MSKRTIFLFVAIVLGLGWAIRGHFGHEHGAAWAGAMAVMAAVIASGRKDWIMKLPVIAAIGGIGWGVGGMMSYGAIVGYGKSADFGNVFYGLSMLAVVGGLYGFIGGGFTGLTLESEERKKPDWPRLLAEMTTGGLLSWGWFIYQLEWLMTPPRSELWAACFGASLALAWYLYRNGFSNALRVAGYAALGTGFGFAFGNFVQTIGRISGASFNWWNVMEFLLGFFGGLGMAYGIFTRKWPQTKTPSLATNWLGIAVLLVVIPATNIVQAFEKEGFIELANRIGISDAPHFAINQILYGWFALVIFALLGFYLWYRIQHKKYVSIYNLGTTLFFLLSVFFIVLSHMRKGFLLLSGQLEQYLYWVILLIAFLIWLFNRKKEIPAIEKEGPSESWKRWGLILGVLILLLIIFSLISISLHSGLPGANTRF